MRERGRKVRKEGEERRAAREQLGARPPVVRPCACLSVRAPTLAQLEPLSFSTDRPRRGRVIKIAGESYQRRYFTTGG